MPSERFEFEMTRPPSRPGRRRRLGILAVFVTAVLIILVVGSPVGPVPGVPRSPAAVFVQDPYMGVSCEMPNSIACDRVGLSVWLARPASVTATVAGARLRLNDRTWSYVAHQDGKPLYVYAGFLRPAGITTRLRVTPIGGTRWLGAYAPSPLVAFRIDYGHGRIVVTREQVLLHAGWG